ncbi:MAG: hypothetical protein DMF52_15190 [Acidobacteria bacterium]|nr:MAG: hypothetical protein DMF52_15190 [Acidobacteriota bacterium]
MADLKPTHQPTPLPHDDRRPWPRPDRPWALAQEWHHVLFLHWPVDAEALRPLVPEVLDIETSDGSAWITALPFAMRRLRLRGLPALPWLSSFPQLNVRTYVTLDGRPGVFLLRVAAGSRIAVTLARRLFHMPYERARLALRHEGESWLFSCHPRAGRHAGAAVKSLSFAARYRPEGAAFGPAPGSLEHWLSERFCYYTVGLDGRIDRGEIDHPPWSLERARVDIFESGWPGVFEIASVAGAPTLAYYSRQTAFAWLPGRAAEKP